MEGQFVRHRPQRTCVASAALATLFAAGAMAAEGPNQDYAALEKAVLDGRDIRMNLDLSNCTQHGADKPGPEVRGSLHFEAYMVQGDGTIAFSMAHLTVRSDKRAVDEFLAFRVHPDGKVLVRTDFLDVPSLTVSQQSEFDCDIGRGAVFHW